MLKRGFTLAEVLITIGIIGVVAALSTPAIMRNTQNAKIGPQLAKFVSTLETGIQAICTDQERLYFRDVITESGDLSTVAKIDAIVGKYIKAKVHPASKFPEIKKLKENANLPSSGPGGEAATLATPDKYYIFPDKSALGVTNCTLGANTGEKPVCQIYAILPGFTMKSKLTLGKDVFALYIDTEGNVRTPGEVGFAEGTDTCSEEQILANNTSGFFCVDRISENGWKAHW